MKESNYSPMLIFPLKKEWYEKIKNGEKTIEYREAKPYWEKRLTNTFFKDSKEYKEQSKYPCSCKLRLGYTNKYMTANISKIEIIDGKNTDLRINKKVYAIHLKDIKEN